MLLVVVAVTGVVVMAVFLLFLRELMPAPLTRPALLLAVPVAPPPTPLLLLANRPLGLEADLTGTLNLLPALAVPGKLPELAVFMAALVAGLALLLVLDRLCCRRWNVAAALDSGSTAVVVEVVLVSPELEPYGMVLLLSTPWAAMPLTPLLPPLLYGSWLFRVVLEERTSLCTLLTALPLTPAALVYAL